MTMLEIIREWRKPAQIRAWRNAVIAMEEIAEKRARYRKEHDNGRVSIGVYPDVYHKILTKLLDTLNRYPIDEQVKRGTGGGEE